MKKIIVILLFIVCVKSNAQLQDILIENDWYLYSLSVDGQIYYPPVNSEMPSVTLDFIDFQSDVIFETQGCNTGNGVVIIDENDYTLTFTDGIQVTLILCDYEENSNFENYYFGFYINNVDTPFNIGLFIIDDPNSNEELYGLEIVSPNGDYAFYNNWILSNEDFLAPEFYMYPNPVTERFHISSAINENIDVLIYDITGKLIITKKNINAQNPIDIGDIESGLYFVQVSDKRGNSSIKRLVKK